MNRAITMAVALALCAAGCVVRNTGPGAHRQGPGSAGPGAGAVDDTPEPAEPPHAMPAGVAKGAPPNMEPGAPAAFWIWQEPGGMWHLRTTTARQHHTFAGRVAAAEGPITDVKPTRLEFGDRIRKGPKAVGFSFDTAGHMDGFDFRPANNGCVRFGLRLDGGPHPKRIFVGAGATEPPKAHFTLCP